MFSYIGHVAIRKTLNKVLQTKLFYQIYNTLHIRLEITHCYILYNSTSKKLNLLWYSTNKTTKALIAYLGNIISTNTYLTTLNRINMLKQ